MSWQEYDRQRLAKLTGLFKRGTKTWDPPATAATQGAMVTTTVTVPGAAVGDPVHAALSTLVAGTAATLDALVSAADTVTVRLINTTAAAVDLGSGTLNVTVFDIPT